MQQRDPDQARGAPVPSGLLGSNSERPPGRPARIRHGVAYGAASPAARGLPHLRLAPGAWLPGPRLRAGSLRHRGGDDRPASRFVQLRTVRQRLPVHRPRGRPEHEGVHRCVRSLPRTRVEAARTHPRRRRRRCRSGAGARRIAGRRLSGGDAAHVGRGCLEVRASRAHARSRRRLGVPREELPALARQSLVLPDYKNHPKVTSLEEVREILGESVADLTS